ncbi:MAG: type IV toxin-antitoxin system AbiEi family antitoxin domain-containing protein [Mobilitalea sp.]
MDTLENARYVFDKYGGMMRTKDLSKEHIYYLTIQKLIEEGYVEKIRYGYYKWINADNLNEISIIVGLFPDGIFCMNTALFYYGYSNRTPLEWHIAVSKDSGKSRFRIEYPFVKPYYVEPTCLKIGLTEARMDETTIRIYDKERVICDCLRYMNKMDKEIFNKAIQSYISDTAKNIPNLMRYAEQLRITTKVKTLIGVWL